MSNPIKFIFPIDGECVSCRDGEHNGSTLNLGIKIEADSECEILVNSVKAREIENGIYTATVPLSETKNSLVAENKTTGKSSKVTVFKLPENAVGGYRISSDDNIIFLAELTEGNYTSIFEHPYLAVYKKAHDLYGAKIHLNLFYEFDDEARSKFSTPRKYFNLSMMTDRYKDEFRQNSDWLKLAFHSRSEFPPKPYELAKAETIIKDYNDVCREIRRFAGKECIPDTTTVHFGSANLECTKALRELGLRSLTGYFTFKNGKPSVSYYVPAELVSHIYERDFFIDTDVDMIFARIDCVLNTGPLDEVKGTVLDAMNDAHRGGFVSIMIHEQYFYRDYKNYLSDFEKRVLEPAKLLFERCYRGTNISDITDKIIK